ncbi:MAG: DUF1236 domain-containing protein [Xanthobacteraceae bacterium]|nr:MAG: DUF1236 domain-containing protein [Xanthobacteraceae bacterium]
MANRFLVICSTAALIGASGLAFAQEGTVGGAAGGAVGGAIIGGPVGAAVGGAAGAVVGGIADVNRPRFREYVIREHRPSVSFEGDVVVGTTLPRTVTYYTVPREYGTRYRYAVVNDRTVLVNPSTRRIVQIIE